MALNIKVRGDVMFRLEGRFELPAQQTKSQVHSHTRKVNGEGAGLGRRRRGGRAGAPSRRQATCAWAFVPAPMRAASVALLWWAALWTATCPRSLVEAPLPAPNQSLSELQLLFPKSCKVRLHSLRACNPVGVPVLPRVARPANTLRCLL